MGGRWCYDEFDAGADYIILDDCDARHIPLKQILGAQREFIISGKYRTPKRVVWGRPCIFLCNPDLDPMSLLTLDERLWLQDNAIIIYLEKPLFKCP